MMKCMRCGKEMRNTIDGCYICDHCGFAVNDGLLRYETATPSNILNSPITDNNTVYPGIGDNPNYSFWGQQGWICPKCGAVLSPSTTYCPFCAPKSNQSTITSNRTGDYINPNIHNTISSEK